MSTVTISSTTTKPFTTSPPLNTKVHQPVLFLDDWPQPPACGQSQEDKEQPGLTDAKKWRLQTLLAVNPWGIPSLAFSQAYEKMFGAKLNFEDFGFDHLAAMVMGLPEVFAVQEADEITGVLFPEYPDDRILHDARLGHEFYNLDGSASTKSARDPDQLIAYAWLNRDADIPSDVVLPGEEYSEFILPMTAANIPDTRGVHQAIVVVTGRQRGPQFWINIKNDDLPRLYGLSDGVEDYFKSSGLPMEMFSVPEEFIFQGFPCLAYKEKSNTWERCQIVGHSKRANMVLVELVDYGGFRTVNPAFLYLMPKQFFDFPKQGVLINLIGLTTRSGKWPSSLDKRLRNFSEVDYVLDCLLINLKESGGDQDSTTCTNNLGNEPKDNKNSKRLKKIRRTPQFEAIVCDRNDKWLDVYLDEILVMETYATFHTERQGEIAALKKQLKTAFEAIPRPVNPLLDDEELNK